MHASCERTSTKLPRKLMMARRSTAVCASHWCAAACLLWAISSATANECLIEKLSTQHLPNAVRVHERVISGGLPEGDAAFAELNALGVKTIVSVDGAKPDLETAAKFGLRYVHLPHG